MLVALKSIALCVLPISTCSHLSCCLYRGWSTDVPLRVRDMEEGDCCSQWKSVSEHATTSGSGSF